MTKDQIFTPAILLDLNVMEHNLRKYAQEAEKHSKQIWPMIKTHKSTELALLQQKSGATGFLCGTLDEAEALYKAGLDQIMYAYPVATEASIARVISLAQRCDFLLRIDTLEAAKNINQRACEAGVVIQYTIIIDSGLHRFGIAPENAAVFAKEMDKFSNLVLKGISTHPGHVYAASSAQEISGYVADERKAIKTAADALRNAGYHLEIISSGSTPTFWGAIEDENITVYHPGNYIFNDVIQMSTETAAEAECALTVLASVISHPSEHLYICDAGAKCLGLDQGAHGNTAIKGYGRIKGHPEATVYGLSEEVGKILVDGPTSMEVGDLIEIIPNHSCSAGNLTNYYVGMRDECVECVIPVDIRGNATAKNIV